MTHPIWDPPNKDDLVDIDRESVDIERVVVERESGENVIIHICGPVIHVKRGPKLVHPWQYPEVWDCETYDLSLYRDALIDAIDKGPHWWRHIQIKSCVLYDPDRYEYGKLSFRNRQHQWLLDHQSDLLYRNNIPMVVTMC